MSVAHNEPVQKVDAIPVKKIKNVVPKIETIGQPGKYSYNIKVTPATDVRKAQDVFFIPVIDVRDGSKERHIVKQISKQKNIQKGSRFMKPSYSIIGRSYN